MGGRFGERRSPLMKRRKTAAITVLLLAASRVSTAAGADQKRIYIAPDDHTDYMWTADEETYRESFLETLDYYLALADATRDNPPGHRSRRNCDGSLWAWTYEKNKTPAEFARTRDGHISVPLTRSPRATAASRPRPCSGACTTRARSSGGSACASPRGRHGELDAPFRARGALGGRRRQIQLEGHLRLSHPNPAQRAPAARSLLVGRGGRQPPLDEVEHALLGQ